MPVEVSTPSLAYSSPPIRRIVGHRAERLDVVDQRRPLVEALVGREGGLQARVAALALQRVEQAGLLAADVRAGAAVDDHREGGVGAEDLLAHEPGGARFGERGVEDVGLQHVLTPDVDERARRAGGVGGDHDPLEQHVRGLLHQLAVLEGAGLGLVGVAHQVLVHPALGQERDLLAHLKAGPPAPAQGGGFELVQHRFGRHRQRLAQRLVAAAAFVHLQGVQAGLVDAVEEELVGHARTSDRSLSFTILPLGRHRGGAKAASRAAPRGRRGCRRAAAGTSASVSGPT